MLYKMLYYLVNSYIINLRAPALGGALRAPLQAPLQTLPTGSDFWLQSHPLLELHPVTIVGHRHGYRGGGGQQPPSTTSFPTTPHHPQPTCTGGKT